MGNCVSAQDREALQRSQEIDRQIEEDSRKFKKECKILLLGVCYPRFSFGPQGGDDNRPRLCERQPSSCSTYRELSGRTARRGLCAVAHPTKEVGGGMNNRSVTTATV